ncbi:hypothetical protein HS125_07135 [bacterium]|nr:hypothetical protein [bacterium]
MILTRAWLRLDARPATGFALVELTDARLFEDEDHRDEYPGTRGNWETDSLTSFWDTWTCGWRWRARCPGTAGSALRRRAGAVGVRLVECALQL